MEPPDSQLPRLEGRQVQECSRPRSKLQESPGSLSAAPSQQVSEFVVYRLGRLKCTFAAPHVLKSLRRNVLGHDGLGKTSCLVFTQCPWGLLW